MVEHIDWNNALNNILANSVEEQRRRDEYEQAILDYVNALTLPQKKFLHAGDSIDDARSLISSFGDNDDFVPVVDGILIRTLAKWRSALLWNLQQPLPLEEIQRRVSISGGLTYRRDVLKNAYKERTGEAWSPENNTHVLNNIFKAVEDASDVILEADYTDVLE